jgi:hypothetical protein
MPAFAVTKNHDGSVTVSIARLAGIPAANARLAALGYRVRVVQVADGCGAAAPRAVRLSGAPAPAAVRRAQVRFDPRQVPPGRVLVIPASRSGQTISIHPGHMIHGQVPACLPPPIGRPGAFPGACCPPPPGMAVPRRQVRAGRPRQVLAGPCPKMRGHRPARHRQIHISVHPVTRSRGGPGVATRVTVSCPDPMAVQGQGRPRQHKLH